MRKYLKKTFLLFLISFTNFAQVQEEVLPPFNIKTISFVKGNENVIPVFELGETFNLEFDDLFGNEANYYYQFVHCDYDWTPSQLSRNEYLRGFDDLRVLEYENSFNTLQMYSHYRLRFPNKNTGFLVSGNYIIKILNDNKEVVFSRKFILYENIVAVPITVRRSRDVKTIDYKQNLDFMVRSPNFSFLNALDNVKVLIFQNSQINSGIMNLKPMYTLGTDMIYKYQTETEFWAGNEDLYFDNSDIRYANNFIARVDQNTELYTARLYTNEARASRIYTYFPDQNGNFKVNALDVEFPSIGADYAWVDFSLSVPNYYGKEDVYIVGMFNNYKLTEENKMDYDEKSGIYKKMILIKQGFTNYQYVLADKKGKINNKNAIDGNYYLTENNYFIMVYYRDVNRLYDRVVGKGTANSRNIIN